MKKAAWMFPVLVLLISTACLTSTPAPILPAPTAQPETEESETAEPETEETTAPQVEPTATPPQAQYSGSLYVFGAKVDGQTDLYLADWDSGEYRRLTNDDLVEDAFFWSPDGSWLSIRVIVEDDPWGTGRPYLRNYLLNIYDGAVIDLVDCPYTCSPARWSPDGTRLAVVVEGEDQLDDLDVFDADGSNRWTLLPEMPLIDYINWSPDGSHIGMTFSYGDMNRDYQIRHLALVDLSGSFTQLTDGYLLYGQVFNRWTPDGSAVIYYEVDEEYKEHWFKIDLGGNSLVELSVPESSFTPFGWMADGSLIATSGNNLISQPLDGSPYSILYEFPWEIYPPALSSDGSAVLVGRYVSDPDTPANNAITEIYLWDFQTSPDLVANGNMLPGLDTFTHLLKWQPVP